eukprot:754952-Hanusia_phi.AAC.2
MSPHLKILEPGMFIVYSLLHMSSLRSLWGKQELSSAPATCGWHRDPRISPAALSPATSTAESAGPSEAEDSGTCGPRELPPRIICSKMLALVSALCPCGRPAVSGGQGNVSIALAWNPPWSSWTNSKGSKVCSM